MLDQDSEWAEIRPASPGRSTSLAPSILVALGLVLLGIALVVAGSGRTSEESSGPKATCRALLRGRECPVFTLGWSPDGRKLAASGFGPTVRLWDLESGGVRWMVGGTDQPRVLLGWSEDGRRLVLGGLEVPAESWDLGRRDSPSRAALSSMRPDDRPGVITLIAGASKGALDPGPGP